MDDLLRPFIAILESEDRTKALSFVLDCQRRAKNDHACRVKIDHPQPVYLCPVSRTGLFSSGGTVVKSPPAFRLSFIR